MTAGDSHRRAPRPTQAILAAALLATTAFIRVPVELFNASRHDFPGAPRQGAQYISHGGFGVRRQPLDTAFAVEMDVYTTSGAVKT